MIQIAELLPVNGQSQSNWIKAEGNGRGQAILPEQVAHLSVVNSIGGFVKPL